MAKHVLKSAVVAWTGYLGPTTASKSVEIQAGTEVDLIRQDYTVNLGKKPEVVRVPCWLWTVVFVDGSGVYRSSKVVPQVQTFVNVGGRKMELTGVKGTLAILDGTEEANLVDLSLFGEY